MSFGGRMATFLVLLAIVVGLVVFSVVTFLTPQPATVDFTGAQTSGSPVNLTVQTVGAIGFGDHPTWVSYMVKDPSGAWVHSTVWKVPAHTRINVTIDQYDSGSPLRNQQWGLVQGTTGGIASLNAKPFRVFDSYSGNGVGHTFSIPTLGISVPLIGVDGNAKAFCNSAAPCSVSATHNVISFSFTTPGPGEYPWQCFVPCGLGFLFGNGGPMSTVNYMGGFLDVAA